MRARFGLALALTFGSAFAAAPTPKSYFGHEMGADRSVVDWDKVVSYFQALAAASDRVRVEILGRSTEGRPLIAAILSAPDTLQHLDRYREIQQRLADPRQTSPAQAEPLFAQGKAIVLIT